MYRIIDTRGSGKSSRLMLLAKDTNSTIVCSNPRAMREKAKAYGIEEIDFISYDDLIKTPNNRENILIDELEVFISYYLRNKNLIGYTLTNED